MSPPAGLVVDTHLSPGLTPWARVYRRCAALLRVESIWIIDDVDRAQHKPLIIIFIPCELTKFGRVFDFQHYERHIIILGAAV